MDQTTTSDAAGRDDAPHGVYSFCFTSPPKIHHTSCPIRSTQIYKHPQNRIAIEAKASIGIYYIHLLWVLCVFLKANSAPFQVQRRSLRTSIYPASPSSTSVSFTARLYIYIYSRTSW